MIRTFVAEPTTLTREGLIAVLSRQDDIELLATVRYAEDVLPAAREFRPDVALIAGAFPAHDGILIARALRVMLPWCRCAILSHTRQPSHLERAIAAHVDGYLYYDSPAESLCASIRQLAIGNKVIDRKLAFSTAGIKACPLTLREAEILKVAARGFSTAEIAHSLCLAPGTVRNYLSHAIAKAGARNRVDVIRIADESGWL